MQSIKGKLCIPNMASWDDSVSEIHVEVSKVFFFLPSSKYQFTCYKTAVLSPFL